ncbi:MAG: hypothetical protein KKB31_02425 [Nanoarchaeota archaeon]|nr:hypothetical protein [Nanoarchaeota archaeon]
MRDISEQQIQSLKDKGLTCSKLNNLIQKQMQEARKARDDAKIFRNFGINSQAGLQEKIAKAQDDSASALRTIRRRVCPLK